jgi:two-component system sensor histidine kinase BaeS
VALLGDAGPTGSLDQLSDEGENIVVLDPQQAAFLLPDRYAEALRAGRPVRGEVQVRGQDLLFAAQPAGSSTLVLLRPEHLDWSPLWTALIVAAAVGIGLAALLALVLARTVVGPVRRVADASRRLASGERPGALPVEGPAETRALARSFNALTEELDRAREAERAFLMSVSHELRTPLTAIRGHAEALGEGVLGPEVAGPVIVREAGRLQRLVQDLLDLARLSVRRFSVRREDVDLAAVADEAVRRYEVQARDFGVALSAQATPGAGASADAGRVLQVVSNLIENALRCAPEGGRVTVVAEGAAIGVADTGPGLAPEELERAFERFFLHDRHRSDRRVGTGLGLAVVQELTEAMGGAVEVESRPGVGTRFTVTLPVPRGGPRREAAPAAGAGARPS